jgi:hypothetical protein
MTQQALDLLQKALSLSDEERADLACSLMESLDAAVEEGSGGRVERRNQSSHRRIGHRKRKDHSVGRGQTPDFISADAWQVSKSNSMKQPAWNSKLPLHGISSAASAQLFDLRARSNELLH